MLAINLNGNRYTSICRMSFSTSEISITVLAVIFSVTASRIKRYGDISVIGCSDFMFSSVLFSPQDTKTLTIYIRYL